MESAATSADAESPPSRGVRIERIAPWLLALICIALYARAINAPLVFDDISQIRESVIIRGLLTNPGAILRETRPVTAFTLALNYQIGELDTTGYHAFNIAVHVLAVLTLFGVVHRVLRRDSWPPNIQRDAAWIASAVALLWAVHPLNTQAVAYIVQRAESIMALCYLFVLYAMLRGIGAQGRTRIVWFAASIVVCAIGMGSKEVMFTAPLMALLFDRLFVAGSFRAIGRRFIVYALQGATWLVLLSTGITRTLGVKPAPPPSTPPSDMPVDINAAQADISRIVGTIVGSVSQGDPTVGFGSGASPWTYLLTQAQVILHYVRLTFWPDPLVLDYAWPFVSSFGEVWWQFSLLGVLFAASVVMLFRRPWIGYAGLWVFVILGPTSSVVPVADAAFEHRMYLPLVGLVVLVVGGGYALTRKRPAVALACLAVVAGALSVRTFVRAGDYNTPSVIWGKAAHACPHNERAWVNHGAALYDENAHLPMDQRVAKPLAAYKQALEHKPDSTKALVNIGACYFLLDEYDTAEAYYLRAIYLRPRNTDAPFRLGVIARRRAAEDPEHAAKHLADAEAWFRRTLSVQAGHMAARDLLGVVLAAQGKHEDAIREFNTAAKAQPAVCVGMVQSRQRLHESGQARRRRGRHAQGRRTGCKRPRARQQSRSTAREQQANRRSDHMV